MNPVAMSFAAAGLGIWILLMPRHDWPSLAIGLPAVWAAWWAFRRVATFETAVPASQGARWLVGVGGYLLFHVPADIVRSTMSVFREVLRSRLDIRPAIVAIPLPEASPEALMLLAYGICLTPGEQVVEIDEQGRILYVHCLSVPDPERFRAQVVAVFERYLRSPSPAGFPDRGSDSVSHGRPNPGRKPPEPHEEAERGDP